MNVDDYLNVIKTEARPSRYAPSESLIEKVHEHFDQGFSPGAARAMTICYFVDLYYNVRDHGCE